MIGSSPSTGAEGVRDPGAIESALARPMSLAAYGDCDVADLAAACAWGLARSHGFMDGNERTAWVVARLFLADNGRQLRFDPAEAVQLTSILSLTEGFPLARRHASQGHGK